jgi:hypothetical protein
MFNEPTAAEVLAYRDRYSIGLNEARAKLTRQAMVRALDEATSLEDLKPIIRKLING